MKRAMLGLGAVVFSCFLMAAARAPERAVKGNRLISKSDPAITIQVPRSAVYLGAERWDLYDVADCELHLFVEAYPDRTVKAMYWIQFEAYLPTNEHSYDYSEDQPVTFAGRRFWKSANFGPTNNTPRAGSDGERTRQMLARAGYKLPAERMSVRLVHLLDESRRKELMIIYGEDLALSGYTVAQLLDGKEPRPEWKAVEQQLVERAMKRIKLSK
jgi:hypothetical protein